MFVIYNIIFLVLMEVYSTIVNCPSLNEISTRLRFLIMDAPSPSNLPLYIKHLQKNHVKHLVRMCGPTYKTEIVEKAGIIVHSMAFEDGAPPSPIIIKKWLTLLDFILNLSDELPDTLTHHLDKSNNNLKGSDTDDFPTIAVHCVAGLGRAPMLVAIALIEYANIPALDAVGLIREKRRGAINQVQLNWLMSYKPRKNKQNFLQECCWMM